MYYKSKHTRVFYFDAGEIRVLAEMMFHSVCFLSLSYSLDSVSVSQLTMCSCIFVLQIVSVTCVQFTITNL